MNVLLINPPDTEFLGTGHTSPPLGLLYIAAYLEKHGHNVSMVDGCVKGWRGVSAAVAEKPDVVGITCLTPQRHRSFEVANLVRERSPQTKIAIGGPHAMIMPKQIEENYDVDAVCAGEGEGWMLDFVEGRQPGTGMFQDIDDIPFPAWHLVDLHDYNISWRRKKRLYSTVIFSRGCSAHCNFCSSWWMWKTVRVRSAKNMVDEMLLLYNKYNVRDFNFSDDIMTSDKAKTIDLCREILMSDMMGDISWTCTTRADMVDPEILDWMNMAGCRSISYGVESGSPKMITTIHKGEMPPEEYVAMCEKTIKDTQEADIAANALIMIGNPGESEETVAETLAFLKRAKPKSIGCIGGVWLMPGTALYHRAKREGMIDDSFWLKDEDLMKWPCPEAQKWRRQVYSYSTYIWVRHVLAKFYPRATAEKYFKKLILRLRGYAKKYREADWPIFNNYGEAA